MLFGSDALYRGHGKKTGAAWPTCGLQPLPGRVHLTDNTTKNIMQKQEKISL